MFALRFHIPASTKADCTTHEGLQLEFTIEMTAFIAGNQFSLAQRKQRAEGNWKLSPGNSAIACNAIMH